MPEKSGKLGIIAGSGYLPQVMIEAAKTKGQDIFAVAISGHANPAVIDPIPHMWARMGEAGKVIKRLRQEGVNQLIFAGGVRRPSLRELRPDRYAARFFFRVGRKALGDDGLLRAVTRVLEEEGFNVIGPEDLISDILAPAGQLGKRAPSAEEQVDLDRGVKILKEIGPLDIGQAAVIQGNIVLGIEAAEGTDRLIERTAPLSRAGGKPVLVKISKPNQDLRFDLPTIGADTLKHLAASGFAGVAVEAGKTILLDAPLLPGLADELGLFLTGIS